MSEDHAVEMVETYYEQEEYLQKIVEDNPSLLLRSSEQGTSRLMLIRREYNAGGYYLDHLFVDQDGIPVFVEVKRSTDTRIRREVVGQMLDYASKVSLFDIQDIRSGFREHNKTVSEMYDTEQFWSQVSANLKAEHIKLVFVADAIPDSLRMIIEFMDRVMPTIEVYGVEIHQFKASGATMLTTNFIANSTASKQNRSIKGEEWDVDSFAKKVGSIGGPSMEQAARDLFEKMHSIGLIYEFGCGAKYANAIVKSGSKNIFKCGATARQCIIEICIPDLLKLLGDTWSSDRLVALLSDFPSESKEEQFIRTTNSKDQNGLSKIGFLLIDLRLLVHPHNMTAFIDNCQKLRDVLSANNTVKISGN